VYVENIIMAHSPGDGNDAQWTIWPF